MDTTLQFTGCTINTHECRCFEKLTRSELAILEANSVKVTYKQSFGRLADILICLSDRIYKKNEFELPLSRKELAELTGMSSETVIRALKKFQVDGIIRTYGKCIEVIDYERLKQISERG